MPPPAQQVNPLALIGQSQVGPNTDLNKLIQGLAQIDSQNAGRLTATKQQGTDALANTALTAGLPAPTDPTFDAARKSRGTSIEAARNLEASSKGRRAGINPVIPKSGNIGINALPGTPVELGDFPGVAQEKIKAGVEAAKKREVKDESIVGADNLPVGALKKRTQTKSSELKGKQQNTPLAREVSTAIIQSVRNKTGLSITAENITGETPTHYIVEIGGRAFRVKKQ